MADGLKRYVYISDTKIDNLFAQISPTNSVVPGKLRLGPAWLSSETDTGLESEQKRQLKLEKVVDWVNSYGSLGTIDDHRESEYVQGTLEMRWGPFDDKGQMGDDAQMVWFGGATERTILGMAGSAHHIIGNVGQSVAWSRSVLPQLMPYLYKAIGQEPPSQLDREDWWLKTINHTRSRRSTWRLGT